MKKPFFQSTIKFHGKNDKREPLIRIKTPPVNANNVVYPRPLPNTYMPSTNVFMAPLTAPVEHFPYPMASPVYTVEPKPASLPAPNVRSAGNSKAPLTHSVGRTSTSITNATVDSTSKGVLLLQKNDSKNNPLNSTIMQTLKIWYQEHKMYVNIALGAVVAYFVWKFTKKKR